MAQRLVRAKRKIATAAIPFVLPPDSELLARLSVVHRVVYLTFNEGYVTSAGRDLTRNDLCLEAIRLSRLLAELVPDDAETLGLAALLLSLHARSDARVDAVGLPVLLPDQDRTLWDGDAIAEARSLLDRSLRLPRGGALQLQAAISQLHNEAKTSETTDWQQIALLYGRLEEVEPTGVVRLNRAVAVAMYDGPKAGLEILDDGGLADELHGYRYYHAARADLLAKLGDHAQAVAAYDLAIGLDGPDAETNLLRQKRIHAQAPEAS